MFRLLVAFIFVAALSAIGAWLADHPGEIAMQWGGYRIETSIAVAALLLLLLLGVILVLYRIWRWLREGPGRIGASRKLKRDRKGLGAFVNGMVAVASGDAREARKAAVETERLLDDTPLTLMLAAEAAELNGDDHAASHYYEKMLERADTEILGLRGLLGLARQRGADREALLLAERAARLKPDTPWVLSQLFELQTAANRWEDAGVTLERAIKRGLVDDGAANRRRSVVLLQRAHEAEAKGDGRTALKLAIKSHEHAPSLTPASVLAARLLDAHGKKRRATRMLAESWNIDPHPDLLATFEALQADETPEARLARVGKHLAPRNPDHAFTQLALGNAALAAGQWDEAREHLLKAEENRPWSAVYRSLAELEEREHGDAEAAREWLAKSASGRPDPTWICGKCGLHSADWHPLCPNCSAFDGFAWSEPTPYATMELLDAAHDTLTEAEPAKENDGQITDAHGSTQGAAGR